MVRHMARPPLPCLVLLCALGASPASAARHYLMEAALVAPSLALSMRAAPQDAPVPPPPLPGEPGAPSVRSDRPEVEEDREERVGVDADRLAEERSFDTYPVSGGRLAAFVLLGVPLTWVAATVPAFAVGALAYFTLLAGTGADLNDATLLPASFLVGAVVGVGITYMMLPAMMKLFGDDEKAIGSAEEARTQGWELGRWALLVGVAGLAMTTGGISLGLEPLVTAGLLTTGMAYLAAWVLDTAGVVAGYQRSRRPRTR
jgi:hypothetical protein